MALFRWLWNGLKALGRLILPVFARAGEMRGLRWLLHILLLAAVLFGLWYVNHAFSLGRFLGHAPAPLLRKIWLPLLFFFVYLLSWVGWWLFKLTRPLEETSAFPDLDVAWSEALAALKQAGIDLKATPVFLVLGRPVEVERSLFKGAELDLTVEQIPIRPDAPLHVYAGADAVYVTCPGASLLARQAEHLAAHELERSHRAAEQANGQREPADADEETRSRPHVRRTSLAKDTDEVDRLTARLKRLCWLVQRDRQPRCPFNGILACLPVAATINDETASQTGLLARLELSAIRAVTQLQCPIYVLLCEMERLPGFLEMAARFPAERRPLPLGRRFPFVTELDPAATTALLESGVSWLAEDLLPPLVHRLFNLEQDPAGRQAVSAGNAQLLQLWFDVRQREKRLARLITIGFASEQRGAQLVGGLYLAATGPQPAFVYGVFRRLLETQNAVTWTPEALAEEANNRRLLLVGTVGLALAVVALIALGTWLAL